MASYSRRDFLCFCEVSGAGSLSLRPPHSLFGACFFPWSGSWAAGLLKDWLISSALLSGTPGPQGPLDTPAVYGIGRCSAHRCSGGPGEGLAPGLTHCLLSRCPLLCAHRMKAKSSRLRNATATELWQRFQRHLQDLQLWRELAQRLLDVTASLPDPPSIHTFLPQIEVGLVLSGGMVGAPGGDRRPSVAFWPPPEGRTYPLGLRVSG